MVNLEPVLLALASRLKSTTDDVSLTTTELGDLLDVSQQTASRYVSTLESMGWIERKLAGRGFTLKLTPQGLEVLRGIHENLGRLLESKSVKSFSGVLTSGIGEGAYYIKEYADKIEETIGYRPYFGTLNVQFTQGKPDLRAYKSAVISAFKSGDRSFGAVYLIAVRLNVSGKSIDCYVIVPERTIHKRDLELIAEHNLRKKYGFRDGEPATISVA
jgi:riboflavin kinase, archaea type